MTASAEAIDISVVIPVYNSSSTAREMVQRLGAVFDGIERSWEVIFVDDGSRDDSWSVLTEVHQADPHHVVAIQLMRNFGQDNAIMCGLRRARGQYIVTMDDDLQHPPEEIPKMLVALEQQKLDVVFGIPDDKKHAAWRNIGSTMIDSFFRVIFDTKIRICSFRVVRRKLIDAILSYEFNFTFIDGLLAWNTRRMGEVTVDHQPRKAGQTGYSIRKLVVLALNLFANFSLLPLQLTSLLGVGVAAGGICVALIYLVMALQDNITVPGYASTIVAILFLGGVQLLALGIIGEYLGRLHMNVNRKPQYSVRNVLSDSPATNDDRD